MYLIYYVADFEHGKMVSRKADYGSKGTHIWTPILASCTLTSQMTLDKFFILTPHFLVCVTAELIELRSDCHLITHGDYM